MRKLLVFLLALMLLGAFGTCALADDWICPNCGRENTDEMNFCGSCRTEKPAESYSVTSAACNAWVCSGCGHICPDTDTFCTRCGAEHNAADLPAVLMDRPVLEEIRMEPVSVKRTALTHNHESVTYPFKAGAEGNYRFWVEDQTSDFSGKMALYDGRGKILKGNDFYHSDPGLTYRLSAGEEYTIVVKGDSSGNPDFTLCVGEPREPVRVNARSVIRDSMDYQDQENAYLLVPEIAGEYRVDVAEIRSGQDIDLKVKDELGYTIKSTSFGASMGSGISFELEAGKRYYVIAGQTTGWNDQNTGPYKLQLSSPNPPVSVSGCGAVGDYMYYHGQKNTYEYTAPETGTYEFRVTADASCEYSVSIRDELGYKLAGSGYSSGCHADLAAGKNYLIVVEQSSGTGDYSLFIQKR